MLSAHTHNRHTNKYISRDAKHSPFVPSSHSNCPFVVRLLNFIFKAHKIPPYTLLCSCVDSVRAYIKFNYTIIVDFVALMDFARLVFFFRRHSLNTLHFIVYGCITIIAWFVYLSRVSAVQCIPYLTTFLRNRRDFISSKLFAMAKFKCAEFSIKNRNYSSSLAFSCNHFHREEKQKIKCQGQWTQKHA